MENQQTPESAGAQPATITVNRGMKWLKHYDLNFNETINRLGCGDVIKGGKSVRTGTDKEKVQEQINNNIKSIDDLIEMSITRRLAIAKSNLETKVMVCGKEISITEALIIKSHTLPQLELWYKHVNNQNRLLRNQYATDWDKWENYIKDMDPVAIESLQKTMMPELIETSEYEKGLAEKINEFKRDIDAALNESNALTTIIL